MTGEKLKSFVIGKSVKPRCFKNIYFKVIPVCWNSNRKAWMTRDLFSQYLRDLNQQMRRQHSRILLYLDNATCHTNATLSRDTLKFFPANTTSVLQPLDQGVIRAFKARYRKRLLNSVLATIDNASNASEIAKYIKPLDAVYWISGAWNETKEETITKCFSKSGFKVNKVQSEDGVEEEDVEIGALIQEVRRATGNTELCTINK